jgi:4-amino-4-deoxy-L-arabinose transferase-like glycosyltransferase
MSLTNPQSAIRNSDAPCITYYALAAIVLLGLGVRLWWLTDYGVWFDEAYHVQLVRLPTVGAMLDAVLSNPPSDPLYVLLLRPWTAMFGYGDAAIRLLSVIFSTATLPVTYWLGRVLLDYRAGLLAALFLAISPYAVEFAQEAALYALASLTTTAALAAGWRWRATGNRRDAMLYVAVGTVAVYSHYVVAVILTLFSLLALMPRTGPRQVTIRAWVLSHTAILAAWLPWLITLLVHWLNAAVPRATLRHQATLSEIGGALTQFSSGTAALLRGVRPLEWAGLLVGGVLILLGWAAGRLAERRGLRLVLAISSLVFLLPALASAITGLWLFVPHFMLFLLPALFVVLAGGSLLLWKPPDKLTAETPGTERAMGSRAIRNTQYAISSRVTFPALFVGWLVIQALGLMLYYLHPPHGADGLRELAATLRTEAKPGDVVLVTPPALTPSLKQYYDGPLRGLPSDFDLRAVYLPYEPEQWQAGLTSTFEISIAGHRRFWLVYRSEWDAGGRFLGSVKERFKETTYRRYEFAELYLFGIR